MILTVELYREGGEKRVWVGLDDGASGACYSANSAKELGEKVALYLEENYPDLIETWGEPIFPPYYHVTNIEWDTTSDDDDTEGYMSPEELGLPSEVDIPLDALDLETYDDVSEAIVEYLSDTWGYCISTGPTYELVEED